MAPRCLLYAGPTLHRAQAIAPVPLGDVVVLPPARRGDIDRAIRVARAPGVIAVVDGLFHLQVLAVGHGELRRALSAGWQVWGLSSMGAIRAAEIAPGNTPTGTRQGEIGAGLGAVGGVLGSAMGMIGGPLGMMAGAAGGGWLGNQAGRWIGDRFNPPNAPTSGAEPGWVASHAAGLHDSLGGPLAGALGGAAAGTMMMPGIGTIAGAIGGGLAGLADSAWNIF